jgi:hypothetical protein
VVTGKRRVAPNNTASRNYLERANRSPFAPNKRYDLQEFLDAVFERVDPVNLAEMLLNSAAACQTETLPNARRH